MIATIILGLALLVQTPSGDAGPSNDGPKSEQSQRRQQELRRTIELNQARRQSKAQIQLDRKRTAAEESRQADEKAERAYQLTLPLVLEGRRQEIEMMRMMQFNAAMYQVAQSNLILANSIAFRAYYPYPYFYGGTSVRFTPGQPVNINVIPHTSHHSK